MYFLASSLHEFMALGTNVPAQSVEIDQYKLISIDGEKNLKEHDLLPVDKRCHTDG